MNKGSANVINGIQLLMVCDETFFFAAILLIGKELVQNFSARGPTNSISAIDRRFTENK